MNNGFSVQAVEALYHQWVESQNRPQIPNGIEAVSLNVAKMEGESIKLSPHGGHGSFVCFARRDSDTGFAWPHPISNPDYDTTLLYSEAVVRAVRADRLELLRLEPVTLTRVGGMWVRQ